MSLDLLARQPVTPGPYYGVVPPTNLSGRFGLPQARMEATLLGGTVRDGRATTFDTVCREARGGIFSCITHGRADIDDPERSGIQLAAPDGEKWAAYDDAALAHALNSVSEDREPEPPLEWVTALEFLIGLEQARCEALLLWGCETHGSGAQNGDNWLGITRAFLAAGRTLVASLWPIEAWVTLLMSYRFCLGLNAGLTMSQALRQAVQEIQGVSRGTVRRWLKEIEGMLPLDERKAFADWWAERVWGIRGRSMCRKRHWGCGAHMSRLAGRPLPSAMLQIRGDPPIAHQALRRTQREENPHQGRAHRPVLAVSICYRSDDGASVYHRDSGRRMRFSHPGRARYVSINGARPLPAFQRRRVAGMGWRADHHPPTWHR